MKKISLKNLNLKEVEKLSREQLKNVLGGFTGGTGLTETDSTVSCPDSCKKEKVSGGSETGSCSSQTIRGSGGKTMTICVCSLPDGYGC